MLRLIIHAHADGAEIAVFHVGEGGFRVDDIELVAHLLLEGVGTLG